MRRPTNSLLLSLLLSLVLAGASVANSSHWHDSTEASSDCVTCLSFKVDQAELPPAPQQNFSHQSTLAAANRAALPFPKPSPYPALLPRAPPLS